MEICEVSQNRTYCPLDLLWIQRILFYIYTSNLQVQYIVFRISKTGRSPLSVTKTDPELPKGPLVLEDLMIITWQEKIFAEHFYIVVLVIHLFHSAIFKILLRKFSTTGLQSIYCLLLSSSIELNTMKSLKLCNEEHLVLDHHRTTWDKIHQNRKLNFPVQLIL